MLVQSNLCLYWHRSKWKTKCPDRFLLGFLQADRTLSSSKLLLHHMLVLIVFAVGFQYRSWVLNWFQPIFKVFFHYCFVTPLSKVSGGVERSPTGITATYLCACPKPVICTPVVAVVYLVIYYYCSPFFQKIRSIVVCFEQFHNLYLVAFNRFVMVWTRVHCWRP